MYLQKTNFLDYKLQRIVNIMWTPGPSATLGKHNVYSYKHKQNNLKVLLCPVDGAAVTAYMRAVNAGSKDEAATTPMGAAHFIEHMSFRIDSGKIWSLASKGDVINAETNMDSTRFYVVHLPEQTPQTIAIDATRFQSAAVPSDKVPVEMNAVLNELERGERAGNKMFKTTSSVAILEHPYHHSTIGTKTDVKRTTAADMEHFRAKYYVPDNTTLIFVGAMDPAAILQHVDTHFGQLKKGPTEERILTQEPPQLGMRTVNLNIPAPCPMICMAFRAPSGSKKESLILQCISQLLYHKGEGRAKELIADNTLHDVSTYSPRQFDPYLWFFHGTQETTSEVIRKKIEHRMLETLQTFITHKVSQQNLDNVKNSMMDEWNRSTESVQDIMNELGRGVSIGNWRDFQGKIDALHSITPDEISNTASTVFKKCNLTVTHVIPTKNTDEVAKTTDMPMVSQAISPDISQLASTQTKTQWSVKKITSMTNLIHAPKANYVRAVLSARFSPAEHDTASLLVAVMGNAGKNTQKNTSELMALHAERNFTHDHEFIHMYMEMPIVNNTLKKASTLMFQKEWLNTNFSDQDIQLQKRHMMSELQSKHADQSYQVKKEFITQLFEKTQYNIPIKARIQRIQNLSTTQLKDFHKRVILNKNSTYVTMTTPSIESAAILGDILPLHSSPPTTTLQWTSKARRANVVHKQLPGFGSASIMVGQTLPKSMSGKEKIAMQIASSILGGGMTGRLMHIVREQKGLGTYGIYSAIQSVSRTSDFIFCIQATFSPDSLKEGMQCTKEIVREWQQAGVTPKELQNAKERMTGSRIIAMDEVDQLSSTALKYILEKRNPVEEMEKITQCVQELTLQEVNQILHKYIDPDTFTEVIVGPV